MVNRNKNNSIVFLTTLSVYLGLVLVGGATPNVLAQTASEIKAEADYLTDEKVLAEYVSVFQNLLVLSEKISVERSKEIKAAFGKEIKDGEYKLDCFYYFDPTYQSATGYSGGKLIFSDEFHFVFGKLSNVIPHTVEKDKKQLKINLFLSGDDFSLKVIAYQDSDEQAKQIFNSYTSELSKIKIQQPDQSGMIYQNTEISRENNQVIIVTRLPRGSLDALLKQNAKAENQ